MAKLKKDEIEKVAQLPSIEEVVPSKQVENPIREVEEEKKSLKEVPTEKKISPNSLKPTPVRILQKSPTKLRVLYSDGEIRWITKIDFKKLL